MSELHADSITKSYNNKVVLSDVFISSEKGKIKGLLGRNGSGKSTLLKIIFGTEKADPKFIKIDEKVIKTFSQSSSLISYLPQHNFLPDHVKIKTLINLFLSKEKRPLLINNPYIKPLLQKQNQHLSGGEKRIIEILLILHSNAPYILLDEPFNGVSPIMKEYIFNYIKNMKSSKGIIVTDHDYEKIISLADTLILLKNGFLKEVKNENALIDAGYLPHSVFSIK